MGLKPNKMTIEELEYRIKLNLLRIKYSKNPMEVVYLCIDNAMILIEFREHFTTPKFRKGIAPVGENNKPEIITDKKNNFISLNPE